MNYKLLLLLIVASPMCADSSTEKKDTALKELVTEQLLSISSGTIIGLLDGAEATIIDRVACDIFNWGRKDTLGLENALVWLFTAPTRCALVKKAANHIKERNIDVNEATMQTSSWVSSWVSYLFLRRYLL